MKGALAIFAKTLGLSAVKTRLAKDIGVQRAEEFYGLSVKVIEELAIEVKKESGGGIAPCWALAEEAAVTDTLSKSFPALWTGEGDLGQCLYSIYDGLRQNHDYVMMIGTDSPQLTLEILLEAEARLLENPQSCIIGPCNDGGFYLFAAAVPIAQELWSNVVYSQSDTLDKLIEQLESAGLEVELLSMQGDVDVGDDLVSLQASLEENLHKLSTQQRLYQWLALECETNDASKNLAI